MTDFTDKYRGQQTLILKDLRSGYKRLCDHVLDHGVRVAPRGAGTLEVLETTAVVLDPTDLFPWGVGRKVRTALLAADALQLVGGFQYPEQFFAINPGMRRFTDFGVFHGAYGPRIRPQLAGLQRRLEQDPYTRKAVLVFWDGLYDGAIDETNNHPCMTEVQFLQRDGVLTTHTRMRANDLWLGTTYDMFTIQQLGFTIANCFGWEAGPYHHSVTSWHLYDEHVEKAREVTNVSEKPALAVPQGFGYEGMTIEEACRRARKVASGGYLPDATESEQWYIDTLAGYNQSDLEAR